MSAPDDRGPVTLGELAAGLRDDFLQWDRGLIGTFIALLWKPGAVARSFIETRDPRWSKPWRYLLVAVVLNIAATWFVLDYLDFRNRLGINAQVEQASALLDNAALVTLIVLPIVALLMRVCFIGLSVRYVDALIVLFYTQAQVVLFGLVALAVLAITGSQAAAMPVSIVIVAYFIWAWASFARGPWWRRILGAVLTLILGQIVNAIVVTAALRLLS